MAAVGLRSGLLLQAALTLHSQTQISRVHIPKPTFQTAHQADQYPELHLSCLTKVAWYKLPAQEFCALQMSEVGMIV